MHSYFYTQTLFFRKKDRVANLITDVRAKYKLKWNVPLSDVEVIEYGPGIALYASPQKTTVTQAKGGRIYLTNCEWIGYEMRWD